MGWADDMYEGGYTREHGGLMNDSSSYRSSSKISTGRKSGPGSKWSEHDRIQMVNMFKADLSIKLIAEKLNRTPLAIAYQLYHKNEISVVIRDKFLNDRSFDTSVSIINRAKYNKNKVTWEKNTKVQKIKPEKDKYKEGRSMDQPFTSINRGTYNYKNTTPKKSTNEHRSMKTVSGVFFIGISVFGWTGYWFAGTGFAALIAFGFLVTGLYLISSNK